MKGMWRWLTDCSRFLLFGKSTGYSLSRNVTFIRIVVAGVFLSAASFLAILVSHGNYNVCFESECFNEFRERFSFSFWVAASFSAMAAIWIAVVKSSQADAALTSTNFYAHRKFFAEVLRDELKENNLEVKSVDYLYQICFPNNSVNYVVYEAEAGRRGVRDFTYVLQRLRELDQLVSDQGFFSKSANRGSETVSFMSSEPLDDIRNLTRSFTDFLGLKEYKQEDVSDLDETHAANVRILELAQNIHNVFLLVSILRFRYQVQNEWSLMDFDYIEARVETIKAQLEDIGYLSTQ